MRIPYGFELISGGTLEVNKDEANIGLGCSFISNLQENVERIYCKMDGKINWLFIEQKPRFSGVSNEINSSA